jgi:predicted DNA binding CopG/RHH family protein
MKTNFDNYKNIAINSWNISEIYEVEVELKQTIGDLFTELNSTTLSFRKSEIKSDLGIATTLLEICKERKTTIGTANTKLDSKFRLIAKKLLVKSVYNQILRLAQQEDAPPKNDLASQLKPEYIVEFNMSQDEQFTESEATGVC